MTLRPKIPKGLRAAAAGRRAEGGLMGVRPAAPKGARIAARRAKAAS